MVVSKSRLAANIKYQKDTYESICVRSRKENRLSDLLELASNKMEISKAQYVLNAIYSQLDRDGITISMLPKLKSIPQKEARQPKQYMVYMLTNEYVSPDDISVDEDGNESYWRQEEFASVFSTLEAAKKYAISKLSKKPYRENWHYTIFGKYYKAMNKTEAVKMFREQIKRDFDSTFFEDAMAIIKPDYEEIVRYQEDVVD